MRKLPLLTPVLLAAVVFQAAAQSGDSDYKLEFDPARDVTKLDRAPEGKDGIYIEVRFFITQGGKRVEQLDDDYKVVIEENGRFIKAVTLPRKNAAEELTVMFALDTSGSMKAFGRMEQARVAADLFLKKLPPVADCGLILFDHEVRKQMLPILEREPLLREIEAIEPRGGTAYLDAASEGITALQATRRGRGRAVVLMTDGIDLNSKKSVDQVIREANSNRVRVYTIGIGEPGKFVPVNTVLALDHSGSMKPPADDSDATPKIEALHLAAQRFVESISSKARVSIVPFSTYVGKPQEFRDKSEVNSLIASIKKLQPRGETALFDATYEAVSVLEADSSTGRRAVVAMTDGIDNSSRRRVKEVIEHAQEANIPLYVLGFGRAKELDETTMRKMAEETKGKFYHAKNKNELIEIFEKISSELHDDGIDEQTLRRIATETRGQYYPAKNVSELKLIFEKVAQDIKPKQREEIFKSLIQSADGTLRNVTLKLARGTGEITDVQTGSYQMRGLVVAAMDPFVYLILLAVIAGLIALPGLLRRSTA
ncbi:MAG: VWA domain-containing protein [Planctomycetes bacterium]|nr:VWA domain-containing protein [Planctomycetota bacterium]